MSVCISYEKILPEDSDRISDFLLENFFPNTPIVKALGLPISQVKRWLPASIIERIQQGHSIQARNEQGQLIGVVLNIVVEKDLKNEGTAEGRGFIDLLNPDLESIMVDIAKFLGLFNQAPSEIYFNGIGKDGNGKVRILHCLYLTVHPSYGRRGIGRKLVEMSEDIAREQGVAFVQGNTTSEFSEKAFRKCGFNVVHEIPFADHIPGIEKVDDGIHRYGRIFLKSLRN